MHKFFVELDQIDSLNISIIGKDVKHIKDVLRLKIYDEIILASDNINYLCRIIAIDKSEICTEIISQSEGISEPIIEITLYQGLSKGSKMDFILQKGTEIGIKNFYPVATHRSITKIKDLKKENAKLDRWNLITEEASKQSKRDYIPKVQNVLTFDNMINLLRDKENIIIPYENEGKLSIGSVLKKITDNEVHLIIGPEGGFEDIEIKKLKEIGGKVVTLGPRILRTETAGFVASTIILYELGNLGVI